MIKLATPKTVKITYNVKIVKGLPKNPVRRAIVQEAAVREVTHAINEWHYNQMLEW